MRILRRNRVKIAIAALVVAIVAFIGLFVRSYNNSGSKDDAGPVSTPTTGLYSPGADGGSSSTTPSAKTSTTVIPSGGVTKYTFPNGQAYTAGEASFFKGQPQHMVELRVFSAGNVRLIRVGWLAPESYDAPYGDLRSLASPWDLTLHSSGTSYHAALFVGTDESGNPVTCQIYVDGKLKDTEIARYPYAHQVCVG